MEEKETLFSLVRAALECHKADLETLDTSCWWRLFRLAQRNHVVSLTADALPTYTPREVQIPWLAEQQKAEGWHRYQKEVQQDIVNTMASYNIETLVLKGTHTAQYYPKPEQREFGDLDLYFYDYHDKADRIAKDVLGVEINADAHHHTRYAYRGVTVESHYDFVNRHYPPSNRCYERLLKKLAPSPDFEVLFLLRHMAGHFASNRLTLRDLVDWALLCQALNDKVNWATVDSTVERYGMGAFVNSLNCIAHRRFGIPLPLRNKPINAMEIDRVECDAVYGSIEDCDNESIGRLGWKLHRWHTLAWKRNMVYNDSALCLWLASITSHATKPKSILHKM